MELTYKKLNSGNWNYVLVEPYAVTFDFASPLNTRLIHPIHTMHFSLEHVYPLHTSTLGWLVMLTLPEGYAWNGPSGPTIPTVSSIKGSCAHDAWYQLLRNNHLTKRDRIIGDKLMYRECLKFGMWKPRAKLYYVGVRAGGWMYV